MLVIGRERGEGSRWRAGPQRDQCGVSGELLFGKTHRTVESSVYKRQNLLIANTTHSLQVPTGTLEYNIR